ncbi:MAG: chromate transporter [Lactobacillaceae bacterium]|jgi:chromate transporter|nr:chromate transporter [Lactobacillaceae bacterium]
MRIIFDLFIIFFKIGLFTFGGGYAMLPILRKDIVDKKHWCEDDEIIDFYSLSQVLPGIIAINVAGLVGYKIKGKIGVLTSVAGMITPSIIVILLIASVMTNIMHNEYVIHALTGVKVATIILILETIVSLWKKSVNNAFGLGVFMASLAFLTAFSVSPVILIVVSSAFGFMVRKMEKKK